jgi:protocatechuate 3,4-dioxygenase beta subunit
MKIRSLIHILALLVVSLSLVWLPVKADNHHPLSIKVSIANGMSVSQEKSSFFGESEGGAISGQVNSDRDGEPIGGARIVASDTPKGEPLGWAISGWDGTYLIAGLAPGVYYLAAAAEGHLPEYFDNVEYPEAATPVAVSDSLTTSNIDFSLVFHGPPFGEGSISGRVMDDSTGRPIEGANVIAVTVFGSDPDPTTTDSIFWMGEAITGSGGHYRIEGLITGDYIVSVSAYDYLPEFYDDVYTPDDATPVHVEEPGNTPHVDFGLLPFIPGNGSISGVVLAEADSTPVKNAWVRASSRDNPFTDSVVETRSDGRYRIGGLMTGDYVVMARAQDFSAEWYDNVKTEEEATPVPVVSPEETPGIDFYLGYLGSISGRVTSELDGSPVAEAVVCAFPAVDSFFVDPTILEPGPSSYWWSYCAVTDSNGSYVIRGVASGEYKVHVGAVGFLNEWYDDAGDWEEAAVVTVLDPNVTPDIDFALSLGGSISGRVVMVSDGEPVAHAWVCVSPATDSVWVPEDPMNQSGAPWNWDQWGCAETDEDGYYVVTGLISGDYYVRARAEGFLPEWYDGVLFREEATPVTVTESAETPEIDFALSAGGSISGQVVSELEETPLHAYVCAISAEDSVLFPPGNIWPPYEGIVPYHWAHCGETDRSGQYTIELLPEGEYFVFAWMEDGLLPEWYNDAPTWKEATLVAVADAEETSDIDFALSVGGRISGRVISQLLGTPVMGATVCAFEIDQTDSLEGNNRVGFIRCAETNEQGQFTVNGLKSGSYVVAAYAWGYREQWFEMANVAQDADPIIVEAPGLTTGIDFAMIPWGGAGSITGRVLDENTGLPIQEAYIEARRGDGWWTGIAFTHEDGTYMVTDLPSGNYYVSVNARGYEHEFFDNAPNAKQATYVAVVDPHNTPDINFELRPKRSNASEGGIAGRVTTVTAESDTIPIVNALVIALAVDNRGVKEGEGGFAVTDERGFYTITDLLDDHYIVTCFAIGFIGEIYDDVFDPREARLVQVIPPDVTDGIDFELAPARFDGVGRITGMIFESDGQTPASEAWVYALNVHGDPVAWDKTGPDGNYVLSGLAPGQYVVQALRVSSGTTLDNAGASSAVAVGSELPMESSINIVLSGSLITSIEGGDGLDLIPEAFALEQNYPNPFNPVTDIRYQIADNGSPVQTTLRIYNLLGQEVRTLVDEPQGAGYYTVAWNGRDSDGRDVATGFYFCRLQAGDYAATIKMVLLK